MNSFIESSCPRDVETESEAETKLAELKERLAWFYQRNVHVIIKPNKHGYALTLQQPQAVIVRPK